MRTLLAACFVVPAALLVTSPALAVREGISGYSGKPNATAPQGESCNQCHTNATAPQVSFTGPTSLQAGQSAEFTLVVRTGLARAGAGIAATDGVVLAPVENLRETFGEMVHDAPTPVSGGQATFRFRVTAPRSGTTLRLWGVGLGSNNNGAKTGDRAAQTTRDVTIVGGSTTPPPSSADAGTPKPAGTPTTSADAGTKPAPAETTAGTGTPTSAADDEPAAPPSGASGEDDDDGEPSARRKASSEPEASGLACSAAAGAAPGSALLSALAVAAVLLSARRRRAG